MSPGAGILFGLLGTGVSSALSILNNRRTQQAADAHAAREQAELEAQKNENPLSRSENQHLLGQYDRQAQQQIENARGVAAITGATPEFTTAVQKGVAEGRANLMGQMAAGASARADRLEAEKRRAANRKYAEDQQRLAERNSTYAALAGNAASAVGSIMDAYSAKAPAFDPNHQSIREGNAAVQRMNEAAATTGVQVSEQPTTIEQELAKIRAGLGVVK